MAKSNPVILYPEILLKYGADQGVFALTLASLHWEGTYSTSPSSRIFADPDSIKGRVNIESLSKSRYSIQSKHIQWAGKVRGDIQRVTITRYLKMLVKSGAMNSIKLSDREAAWEIQQKSPQVSSVHFGNTCEWCGSDTACLHDHHYPIRRSHGGTETVAICPNCHTEFHQLTDWNLYAFSEQFLNELEELQDKVA